MIHAVVCLLWALGVWADIEKMDHIYYRVVSVPEDVAMQMPEPGTGISVDGLVHEFFLSEEREELNKNTSLIDRIDKILGLTEEKLAHVEGSTKIVVQPFKGIHLETDEGVVNVGQYTSTFEKKGEIIQQYTRGDRCDICQDKKWKGTVIYKPDTGPLQVTGPIESSTCNYQLIIKGSALADVERYKVLTHTKHLPSSQGVSQGSQGATDMHHPNTGPGTAPGPEGTLPPLTQ
ncbi:hypothetical protein NEDG_01942 [Nematocida displodere]|uniref:Uncharacterized protein n=1 Tax=Nematocida displodere TaxID=1805483 RepID=A0A177EHG8_9MICR|nr:hypothetical protein NEDG_01942 [Nematocida displodere]